MVMGIIIIKKEKEGFSIIPLQPANCDFIHLERSFTPVLNSVSGYQI